MNGKYSDRIKAWCAECGIEIPPGFHRHPASRYVAIDEGRQPARLVATTWFKQQDMAYYATRIAAGSTLRFLDFKSRKVLHLVEGRLVDTEESF
ncbi:MAG: hypothetical protein AB7O69_05090 [Burkholderiales bacterium]